MGDRRRRGDQGNFDDRKWNRDRDQRDFDFSGSGRYDRSHYTSGASRDSSVKTGRGRSLRRESGYDNRGQVASAGGFGRRVGSHSVSRRRQPYADRFFDDMRIKETDPWPEKQQQPPAAAENAAAVKRLEDLKAAHPLVSREPVASYSRESPNYARGGDVSSYSRDSYGSGAGKKHSSKRRRKLPIILGAVLAVVLLGGGAAFAYMNNITGNLHSNIDDNLRNALVKTDMANEPFYLLLLGTDGSAVRDGDAEFGGMYRSDSMMLARIDPVEKKVALVSIGRDTMVDLPGYGEQKINAAYGLGGPALAVETVSQLAGVPISHYAQVDFDGFSGLVDALGGIEVDVPVAIDDWEAGGSLEAGEQTLDGDGALILCRSRNTFIDNAHPDAMRAANQRLVLSAIAKKLLDSDIATIAGSVQALSQFVSTDLEITDIIGLAQTMKGLDSSQDIFTAAAPTTSQYVGDMWCEYIDKGAWKSMIERMNKGLPPAESTIVDETTGLVLSSSGGEAGLDTSPKYASVTVKNGTNIQGAAAQTRTKLMDSGFVNVMVGDVAEGYAYPHTLVVYNNDNEEYEAEQIVRYIGQGQAFKNDGSYLLVDADFLVIIGEDWKAES